MSLERPSQERVHTHQTHRCLWCSERSECSQCSGSHSGHCADPCTHLSSTAGGEEGEGHVLMELLVWGAIFAVPEIVAECEGRLARFLSHDNVCKLLQIAIYYG